MVAFVAAVRLLPDSQARAFVAFALVALGAVSLGAWIALLASHDYPGREVIMREEVREMTAPETEPVEPEPEPQPRPEDEPEEEPAEDEPV